jgi:hypothetical protein
MGLLADGEVQMKSFEIPLAFLVSALAISGAVRADAQVVPGATDEAPAVLWTDPGPVETRDLRWGMGRVDRAPAGSFKFVEEDTSGTQAKVVVTDRDGETWEVKFGPEAHSEIAANRLLWALGYLTEEVYFVHDGVIQGASKLDRAAEHIDPDGRFERARFRRRDATMVRTDEEWTFKANPFLESRELAGLRMLMTLINNWDIRGSRNNKVLRVTRFDGTTERWFIVSDLGGSFGKMGGLLSGHSKWNLQDYLEEGHIERVAEDEIHLDYDGWDSGLDRVSLDDAAWFAALAGRLTPEQVQQAFQAAGATPEEVTGFSQKFLSKIADLKGLLTNPHVP